MNFLLAAFIGLVGGVTGGLFGVGGGIVMVPAMVMLMKTDMKTAVATSLVVIIPMSLMNSIMNQALGRIDWRMVLALVPLAIAGGLLGTWLKEIVPSLELKRAFGVLVALAGLKLLFEQ